MDDIRNKYFEWLLNEIGGDNYHRKLLEYLYSRPFVWVIPLDENREADGLDLRNIFENNSGKKVDGPCSVLEMMIALSIRCEYDIMTNYEEDNTSKWFWAMVSNLCLYDQTDNIFNEGIVASIIDNLLERKYLRNGVGSLFKISDDGDARKMDIWKQMCSYLNSLE